MRLFGFVEATALSSSAFGLLATMGREHLLQHQKWEGRIVVRTLGSDVQPDYEQQWKPKSRQINPSSLLLISSTDQTTPTTATEDDGTKNGDATSNPHETSRGEDVTTQQPGSLADETCGAGGIDDCETIRIDVTLTSTSASLSDTEQQQQVVTFNMLRQANEQASNCLKRLELSMMKKLSQKFEKKNKGKGKKQKVVADSSSRNTIFPSLSTGSPEQKVIENTSEISNLEFWCLGGTYPMTITVDAREEVESRIPLQVVYNPPTIISVKTFESFTAEVFPQIPIVVQVKTMFATDVIIDWYVDNQLVSPNSSCYVPTTVDGGKSLSVLITPTRLPDHKGHDCQEAYQFTKKIANELPENGTLKVRKEWLSSHVFEAKADLRVMSYNILADQNAFTTGHNTNSNNEQASFFPWVSTDILVRSRRMPLILHEILAHIADVICLQEVDKHIFENLLQPVLGHYHYQGFYSLKQTDGNNEGCAMFWSLTKFQKVSKEDGHHMKTYRIGDLLSRYLTAPAEESDEWNEAIATVSQLLKRRPDLHETVVNKLGHIVQIASLKDIDGNPLLVANTHLFFQNKAPHIRALQCFAIAHKLNIEQTKQQQPDETSLTPFILCGDLNSSLRNAAFLLLEKKIPKNYRNYRECLNGYFWDNDDSEEEEDQGGDAATTEKAKRFDDDFPELRLPASFPDIVEGYQVRPDFTHYIIGFQGTLDHILMSSQTSLGKLRPLRQADIPSIDQVTSHQAMPSPNFPSDHLSIVCDIEWTPMTTKSKNSNH